MYVIPRTLSSTLSQRVPTHFKVWLRFRRVSPDNPSEHIFYKEEEKPILRQLGRSFCCHNQGRNPSSVDLVSTTTPSKPTQRVTWRPPWSPLHHVFPNSLDDMNLNINIHKFIGKYLYEIVAFNNYEHIAQSMHLLNRCHLLSLMKSLIWFYALYPKLDYETYSLKSIELETNHHFDS